MAIDFAKLNTPEARAEAAKHREELTRKMEAKEASQLRMIAYLVEQVEADEITNDWERRFIQDLNAKCKPGWCFLTEKQDEKLTQLFEKY